LGTNKNIKTKHLGTNIYSGVNEVLVARGVSMPRPLFGYGTGVRETYVALQHTFTRSTRSTPKKPKMAPEAPTVTDCFKKMADMRFPKIPHNM
jgi:hypothetical protein